ncbi:MAG: nucleotide exchange factor GrpE [Spirochaetales bacterium]|nr:nucleotide exchange factor GrpE [Spirochaetales bacterium]
MSKKEEADNKNNIPDEGLLKEEKAAGNGDSGDNGLENNGNGEETGSTDGFTGKNEYEESAGGESGLFRYQKRIQDLEEENSSLKDQLLRKQADYENFRKRLMKEKEEAIKFANQLLLLDILTIIDDFERAIKSSEESKDFTALHDGIILIEKQLVSILEKKWSVKRFESVGEVFDPDKHLAIAAEESGRHDISTVIEDYQKGYLFFDRVLRPAKVKVAQPVKKEDENNNTDHIKNESHNDEKQGG